MPLFRRTLAPRSQATGCRAAGDANHRIPLHRPGPETESGPGEDRVYGRDSAPRPEQQRVFTLYFRASFDSAVLKVGGRPVVTRYDPEDWPYPPETDYQKEWDEAQE